jgi:hypothetical protein
MTNAKISYGEFKSQETKMRQKVNNSFMLKSLVALQLRINLDDMWF